MQLFLTGWGGENTSHPCRNATPRLRRPGSSGPRSTAGGAMAVASVAHSARIDRDRPSPGSGLAAAGALSDFAPRQACRAHGGAHGGLCGRAATGGVVEGPRRAFRCRTTRPGQSWGRWRRACLSWAAYAIRGRWGGSGPVSGRHSLERTCRTACRQRPRRCCARSPSTTTGCGGPAQGVVHDPRRWPPRGDDRRWDVRAARRSVRAGADSRVIRRDPGARPAWPGWRAFFRRSERCPLFRHRRRRPPAR